MPGAVAQARRPVRDSDVVPAVAGPQNAPLTLTSRRLHRSAVPLVQNMPDSCHHQDVTEVTVRDLQSSGMKDTGTRPCPLGLLRLAHAVSLLPTASGRDGPLEEGLAAPAKPRSDSSSHCHLDGKSPGDPEPEPPGRAAAWGRPYKPLGLGGPAFLHPLFTAGCAGLGRGAHSLVL